MLQDSSSLFSYTAGLICLKLLDLLLIIRFRSRQNLMGQWVAIVWQVCFILHLFAVYSFILNPCFSLAGVHSLPPIEPLGRIFYCTGPTTATKPFSPNQVGVVYCTDIPTRKTKAAKFNLPLQCCVLERLLLILSFFTNHQVDSLENAVGIFVLLSLLAIYIFNRESNKF